MGFFQSNINILRNFETVEADVAAVADAITMALREQGWEPAGEGGPVERTTLIAPHVAHWLTVVDDAFDEGPDVAWELADKVNESIPRPLLIVQINDNAVDELVLCHRGRADRVARNIEQGWKIPAGPPWSALLEDQRLHLSASSVYHDLEGVIESLGLSMTSWLEFASEYVTDPTGSAMLLEFRKAGSGASAKSYFRPKAGKSSKLMIPAFLCGHPKEVKRRWRKIMGKLLQTRSWELAMEGEEFISVDQAPDVMSLEPPFEGADSDMVVLYVVPEVLCDAAAEDQYKQCHLVRDLFLEGMQQFWVCLTALGGNPRLLLRSRDPIERKALSLNLVEQFVAWWDQLCELEGRFYDRMWRPLPWPDWAGRIWRECSEGGMPDGQIERICCASPKETGDELRKWLAATRSDDI